MKTNGKNDEPSKVNDSATPKPRDTYEQRRNMATILRLMQKGKLPTAKKLSEEFGVTVRTVRRYFASLREEQTLNAKYDRKSKTFHCSEDLAFSDVAATESEMMAMSILKKDLSHRQAAGLDKSITRTFKKLIANASSKVVKKLEHWERIISFRMSGETISDPKTFDTLVKAAGNYQQLKIGYRDPEGNVTEREINSLHMSCVNGDWYLFAYDFLRGKVRTFCPCRIKSMKPTGKTFEWPEGWTVDKHLEKSFGVFDGDEDGKEYQTVIRFKERVADFIREKTWKGQTAIIELPGGGVELHQTLSSLREIQFWVMKWGKNAKVMSPPQLRDNIHAEVKAMSAMYETDEW